MANVIRTGSATASTNGGHDSNAGCAAGAGAFVLGHPEKLKDFAERSFHEMTVDAKTLISAYYGNAPKLSFLDECGGGSRQALTEIQRFPDDYDAVAAGGLDGHSTHHVLGQLWVWQATHKDEASYIPPAKYQIIHQAAVEACDVQDGVKDGVISDPTRCKFDPGVLECKGGDSASCLTAPQVEAARKIYAAPANPRTKQQLFGPLLPGSELGWAAQAGTLPFGYGADFFRYLVFKDPNWNPTTRPINFDSDAKAADAPENLILNANNPDISKFIDHGGKLFIMGGWADTGIAPFSNTEYYEAMVAKMGAKKMKDAVRFYMVPDMGHCPGTVGASAYAVDTFHLIQDWKEKGETPDQLIMTHFVNGKEDRKVLVCQYPQAAAYKGSGDINDPANYLCKAR
jgi:feruloyl esterase